MALKKTQLLDITSVTGINTVGIFTVGVTPTAGGVGVASTSYIKNIIMHNTGLGTARVSAYINPNTTPVITGFGVTANRFLRLDLAPNETTFFESTYPIVMTDRDSLTVEIQATRCRWNWYWFCRKLHCQWRHGCLIMGIKAFNHGDDFVNKFVRAVVSDSTGLDAVAPT